MNLYPPSEELIKRTIGRCPTCNRSCLAEVLKIGRKPQKVYLRRHCPEHGSTINCISSDGRFYWLARGNPGNEEGGCNQSACCAAEGTDAGTLGRNVGGCGDGPFEKLSTCVALIEVVDSCNLMCPTCYADSLHGSLRAASLNELKARIQGVIDRKGAIDILQLSGGEPTLHPRFFELLEWALANPGIAYVLLNTNGVRVAGDDAFAMELKRTFRLGRFQLYLQFDGTQESAQLELRGADLRAMRVRVLERCREMQIPVTLAMTVTPANLPNLWEAIAFGLRFSNVRGISFQPLFGSGRTSGSFGRRLNTADIILAVVEQSGGKLRFEDFTPLPCGDPNCATIGYLLKFGDTVRSISDFINFQNIQGFLRDRVRYELDDLVKCGCESEPLGEILKQFEMDSGNTFRLFIKPFMDSWSWDEDRVDRCCTHVIRPDGKLDSFCRYYATA